MVVSKIIFNFAKYLKTFSKFSNKMKNIFKFTATYVALAFFAVSCGSPKPVKTIENLRSAIEGETNASASYLAYSIKAAEEGFPNVAKMFAAASKAEAIHVENHNAVLVKLGEQPFNPTPDAPDVKSTVENIYAAIDGETYEFTVMYPGFIADATTEKSLDAVETFEWAMESEKTHAKLYAEVLEILKETESDETVPSTWYTCPKCGDLFHTLADCTLCATTSSSFLKF